jgi:hypothetical protein
MPLRWTLKVVADHYLGRPPIVKAYCAYILTNVYLLFLAVLEAVSKPQIRFKGKAQTDIQYM